MNFFDRHSHLRRALAVLLAFTVSACATWRPAVGSPDAVIAGQPHRVRVILAQGDTLVLYSPTVQGDTVTAYRQRGVESSRTTLLLRDVRAVEVGGGASVGEIGGGVAVFVVLGLVAIVAMFIDCPFLGCGSR